MPLIIIFVIMIVPQILLSGTYPTFISDQQQFDAVVEWINKGEEMQLELAKRHFFVNKSIIARANLSIFSEGATISFYTYKFEPSVAYEETDDYYLYKLKSSLGVFPLFYDSYGNLLFVSESVVDSIGVNLVSGHIIAPNYFSAETPLKIPISPNLYHLKNKSFSYAFGYFDCGWQVINFSIERSDNKFFYCSTLESCRTKNYEYDKIVYTKPVRYVIYNAEMKQKAIFYDENFLYVPKDVGAIYCIVHSKFGIQNPSISTFSDFVINGVNFVGFDGIRIRTNDESICEIVNCKFKNCLGYALSINNNSEGKGRIKEINKCTFQDCSVHTSYMVMLGSTFKKRPCINMSNCYLSRYSDSFAHYKNPNGGIYVDGDVALTNNIVHNTSRCHLYIDRGQIVASSNVLYNDDLFNSFTYRNLSCDFGLVYCNSIFTDSNLALKNKNHSILLDSNLIYGALAYGNDARGIFIDNGRGDVLCRNNVIFDTDIYSLDSREVVRFPSSSSARNIFEGNILGTKYRLVSGSDVPDGDLAISDNNILLGEAINVKNRIKTKREDRLIELHSRIHCNGGKVIISKADYRKLKKINNWKYVKKYFVVK